MGVKGFTGSDCPFCLARQSAVPVEGTRLMFLSGPDANCCGVVAAERSGGCRQGEFFVQMEYETRNMLRIVSADHHSYIATDQLVIPAWMLPLSTDDNRAFHDALVGNLPALILAKTRSDFCRALAPVISMCWQGRLPVTAEEVWAVLAAHRAPREFEEDAVLAFNLGIDLLTSTNGRPAVKRRRMKPMSKGRYLTSAGRALWLRIFRHQ